MLSVFDVYGGCRIIRVDCKVGTAYFFLARGLNLYLGYIVPMAGLDRDDFDAFRAGNIMLTSAIIQNTAECKCVYFDRKPDGVYVESKWNNSELWKLAREASLIRQKLAGRLER